MACKQVRFTTRYGEKVSFKSCGQGRSARGRRVIKPVATYTIDGKKISVEGYGKGPNRYYDIYDDSTGTHLNAGEPWYDDDEGVPSREDVAWLLTQGRKAKGRKAAHKRRRPKGACRNVSFKSKGKRVNFRACR